MALRNSRQQHILDLARKSGFVTVDDLLAKLDVTPQTLRRDINSLCNEGILSRFHGGAAFRSSIVNLPYEARLDSLAAEKDRIAAAAAAEIPDNSSVFIDIGTTAEAVARHLRGKKKNLRIVTNNFNVAAALAKNEDFTILTAPGEVRHRDLAITGPLSAAFIAKFKIDYAILGVVAISIEGDILDFFIEEELTTQAIIGCARHVFAVADHSKLGRSAMAKVGHVRDLSALVTDTPLDGAWRAMAASAGLRVIVAPPAEEPLPAHRGEPATLAD